MDSGLFDSRGKQITNKVPEVKTSKYDKVVGNLGVGTSAGSPITGGRGLDTDRVGISTFLGTIRVKDNGGTEKVTLGKLNDGSWGLTVYDGVLIGGDITIGSGNNVFRADETGVWAGHADKASAPFVINMDGSISATSGEIGGFAITPTKLYGGRIQTSESVEAGDSGVVMDSDGLRGYDSILGLVFNLPTDGSAPEFSSGIIKNTEYQLQTNAVIRTSDTVGDGTADSAGVLINNTGIYAVEANQTLGNANVRILATGEAVFSGSVKGGQTDYLTGVGYFIGLSGGEYKMSVGDPAANYIAWDGDFLRIKGNLELASPLMNAVYATSSLPIPPTSTSFNFPSSNS